MAHEDLSRVRLKPDARNDRDDRSRAASEVPVEPTDRDRSERGAAPVEQVEAGVPEVAVETPEELVARERRELIEEADATEIIDGGVSTTAYRRASAVFEPDDDRLQLAEHWNFRSSVFERHGRF